MIYRHKCLVTCSILVDQEQPLSLICTCCSHEAETLGQCFWRWRCCQKDLWHELPALQGGPPGSSMGYSASAAAFANRVAGWPAHGMARVSFSADSPKVKHRGQNVSPRLARLMGLCLWPIGLGGRPVSRQAQSGPPGLRDHAQCRGHDDGACAAAGGGPGSGSAANGHGGWVSRQGRGRPPMGKPNIEWKGEECNGSQVWQASSEWGGTGREKRKKIKRRAGESRRRLACFQRSAQRVLSAAAGWLASVMRWRRAAQLEQMRSVGSAVATVLSRERATTFQN